MSGGMQAEEVMDLPLVPGSGVAKGRQGGIARLVRRHDGGHLREPVLNGMGEEVDEIETAPVFPPVVGQEQAEIGR
jgi:hypothetical protein